MIAVELDPLRRVKKLRVPAGPHDAYTSADGRRIYIGAQYGSAVIVIDPATQNVLYNIPVPAGARPLEPRPTPRRHMSPSPGCSDSWWRIRSPAR